MGQHLVSVALWGHNNDGNNNSNNMTNKQNQLTKSIPRKPNENDLQRITNDCLNLVYTWFPELHERTYYMPPVHMNKVTYGRRTIGGVDIQEVVTTAESDWRDDEVMQRVLHCLRRLTDVRKEPMVVLLQMKHENYLNKRCYAAAAARYPRPLDLPTNLQRGDFDLLFLHRDHGLSVAEIKSVGWRPGEQQDDTVVRQKVDQALAQLNKAEVVLTHLVSDLKPTPGVKKTLVLPNVSTSRLLGLLENDDDLATKFCECFDVTDITSAVSLCLCSDQMTSMENPSHVIDTILDSLQDWWRRLLDKDGAWNNSRPDLKERKEVYELLVARFCGPASTVHVYCVSTPRLAVELRTLGDAVSETGKRMMQFTLFPEQLDLLQSKEKHVYLTGPPGTGKTLVLILVALKWVKQGHVVHVVSTGSYSEAATQLVYYQVIKTLKETDTEKSEEAVSRVKLHLNGNSRQNQPVIEKLLKSATGTAQEAPPSRQGGQLFVVADEVDGMFGEFFSALAKNVDPEDLNVWAATYYHRHRPDGMREENLNACLRCTPRVKRRMQTAVSFIEDTIYAFHDTSARYLGPTDGPPELYLSHEGHQEEWAFDCELCGQAIADCLHNKLSIGKPTCLPSLKAGKTPPAGKAPSAGKTPPALEYRDVMVIPDWYQDRGQDFHDDIVDPVTREITHPASGLVRGLRSKGVPVQVVRGNDSNAIRDMARSSENKVWVVGWGVTNGLERKVVVSIGEGRSMGGGRVSGVLHGASRCTSQLVYVKCPERVIR